MGTASPLASALTTPPASRRREVLERYAALSRQTDCQILGIAAAADVRTVKEAYRRLARRFHPDALDRDSRDLLAESQAIFTRVTEAYQALMAGRPEPAAVARPLARPAPAGAGPTSGGPRRVSSGTGPASGGARRPASAVMFSPPGPGETRVASARPSVASLPVPPSAAPARLSVDEAIDEARRRLDGGDARGAVGLLHGVLARGADEDGRRVRQLLARAYAREPRWRRYAVAQLRSLIEEQPCDVEALTLLGAVYRREGLLARAEALLKRALAADPARSEARRELLGVRAARAEAGAGRPSVPSPPSALWKRIFRREP
jgi:tetratricopeptide (TPR) repeat protein